MNRSLTILFLLLFLFFIIGYKAVFLGLQYKAVVRMDQRLDHDNLSEEETLQVKIPISLPYQIHPKGYQSVSGKFEHEGEFYHLVKQKIEHDTLYVVLARNIQKKNILAKMVDFENVLHNFPASSQKTKLLVNHFIKDYISHKPLEMVSKFGSEMEVGPTECNISIITRNYPPFSPPPELTA